MIPTRVPSLPADLIGRSTLLRTHPTPRSSPSNGYVFPPRVEDPQRTLRWSSPSMLASPLSGGLATPNCVTRPNRVRMTLRLVRLPRPASAPVVAHQTLWVRLHDFRPFTMMNTFQFIRSAKLCLALSRGAEVGSIEVPAFFAAWRLGGFSFLVPSRKAAEAKPRKEGDSVAPSGAGFRFGKATHGLRRGLSSFGAPHLSRETRVERNQRMKRRRSPATSVPLF